jgi:DNA primase
MTGEEITRHKIRCPFHEDNTPSLHVYENDSWHCFSCKRGGDVISFVGYFLYGQSYDPATHFVDVVDKLGALDIKPLPRPERRTKPASPRPALNLDINQIMQWHDNMTPQRREYWYSRYLTDRTIDEFWLGWDGRRYTIPALYRYIPFGVKRRQSEIDDGEPAKYTSVKGSIVGLFNSDILIEARNVIICEGEIDCMLLHQMGYRAVTSTGGAGSWKPEWAKFFTHIQRVYVLFDNDKAGREGGMRVHSSMRRAKLLTLPEGIKDIGELFSNYSQPVAWLESKLQ